MFKKQFITINFTYKRAILSALVPVLLLSTVFVFAPNKSQAVIPSCTNNQPPIPVIEPLNPTIEAGQTIIFSAESSSDPDTSSRLDNRFNRIRSRLRNSNSSNLSYSWIVKDLGIEQSGKTLELSPTGLGQYEVKLTVSDGCDSAITSTLLTVEAKPEPPLPPGLPNFQSQPVITILDISSNELVNGVNIELFKFRITADTSGDIGFYKAVFDITANNANLSGFVFKEYQSNGVSGEVNLTNDSPRQPDEIITANTNRLNILFDTGNDGVSSGGEFRFISAGTSKVFKLFGNVSGTTYDSSVSIDFLSDEDFPITYPASAGNIDADINDNFIWSDLHFGNSSSTATNTAEWFSGFLIFDSSQQTLTSLAENEPEPPQEDQPDSLPFERFNRTIERIKNRLRTR